MNIANNYSDKDFTRTFNQKGVALIELMIALAIGLLITLAMLKIYVDTSNLYQFNESLARIQENGRFALEFIRRDTRAAGFWGCYNNVVLSNNVDPQNDSYIDVSAGYIASMSDSELNNSDNLTLRSAWGHGSLVTQDMSSQSDHIIVQSANKLKKGELVIISDCENGDIFMINEIRGNSIFHSSTLSNTYKSGSYIYLVKEVTYCIANSDVTDENGVPIPSLKRSVGKNSAKTCPNGNELVEGVENMQLKFGEDTDSDNNANQYIEENTKNLSLDRVNSIVSVRLSLLLRSIRNNVTSNSHKYTFNGSTVTPSMSDRHLRKVFKTTITLRNRAG